MSNATLNYFNSLLPTTVTFNVYRGEGERVANGPFSGLPSYFNANVSNITGYLPDDGNDPLKWDAWCVDTDTFIPNFTNYTADVYSTYETIPSSVLVPLDLDTSKLTVDANEDGYVDRLQALNWLFNFVIEDANKYTTLSGTTVVDSGYEYNIIGDSTKEVFSVATMQIAIWTLLGQPYNTSTSDDYFGLIGTPDVALANQLVTYVTTGGRQNFVPTAGQTVAVILAPTSGINQPIVIEVPVPQPPPIVVPPTFEKYVNGVCICGDPEDYVAGYGYKADDFSGPAILAGKAVTWTYVVKGSGNPDAEALSISLTDDNGTPFNNTDNFAPTLVSGDTDLDGKLDFNETWVYKATGTAIFDPASVDGSFSQFTNTAKLTYTFENTSGELIDTATYNSYKANIKLDKVTSDGVNTGDGIEVLTGAAITWNYTVTNLGTSTIALKDIKIVDDNGTVGDTSDDFSTTSGGITYLSGDDGNSLLDVGESWVFSTPTPRTARLGNYQNKATVTANPNGLCDTGDCITASDVSSYTGIPTGDLKITKTDGLDCIKPGEQITYTIVVSNDGTGTATSAIVKDNISPLLTNVSWTSRATGGATGNDNGIGNTLHDEVTLVGGSSITYTVTGTVATNALQPTSFTAATFNLQGSSSLSGTYGNTRTFFAGGVKATAFAFSQSKSNPASFSTAYLGSYSGGLGVTNRNEGDGSGNAHVTDNSGSNDYIVFQFDQSIVIDKASLGYVVDDSDFNYWVGTTNTPITTSNLGSTLSGAMFTEVNNGGSTARTADINNTSILGNFFIIAAETDETNDGFKVKTLDINKPVTPNPITLTNTATVTAPTGFVDTDLSNNSATDSTTISTDCGGSQPCVETVFKFEGSSSLCGTYGNVRSFSKNGIDVNARAFSRDTTNGYRNAFLGIFGQGLGVTNRSEGDGSNGHHRVDNSGSQDYILFKFSQDVQVDRTYLDSVVGDSDITVWFGNSSSTTVNDALLNSLTREDNNTTSSIARWADVNAQEIWGNTLVIGASISDSTPDDAFKVRYLDICAPLAPSYSPIFC
jgi:uncharacterized repeat protein (TIGR01451 family)